MIGPLPTAPGGFNRVLVAIDKFTKWIEVKPDKGLQQRSIKKPCTPRSSLYGY
jgi:hypothetical protein